MTQRLFPLLVLCLLAAGVLPAGAQAPGVPIEAFGSLLQNGPLLEKAKALHDSGKLLDIAQVQAALSAPLPSSIALPVPRTTPLPGREIAARARAARLLLGWYYLCPRCDHWHLNLSDSYAISTDGGVSTCHHVIVPMADMREGYLVAVDPAGEVLAVSAVLAKSQTLDAAIVRVEGGSFTPLALNEDVAPGDPAYCLSDPLGQRGYFSEGVVNRFYWKGEPGAAPDTLDALKHLRVNVSTDWAPGSSGAAVLDACGNAIGHVSTISPLREGNGQPAPAPAGEGAKPRPAQSPADRFNGATLITLHEAVPARSIRALAQAMNEAAAQKTLKAE